MNKKSIFKIIAFVLLTSAAIIYFTNSKRSGIKIPELNPRGGSANSSSEFIKAAHAVDYYREEIRKHPDISKNYIELAQLFIQESRITGMHHKYIPKAQELIDIALEKDPDNLVANVTKASLLMTLHQFNDAGSLIEKITAGNPFYANAYGILVDANVETGHYNKAVKACDKMLSIRPELSSYSRASYLREIYGMQGEAIAAMKMAADAGMIGQENRAWTLYNLGNLYLNEGKLDTASFIFNGILQERPGYAYALFGLANIYAYRKNYTKAIENLVQASQNAPQHIFIERLADIYKVMGQKESEEEVIKKVLDAFELHKKDGYDIDLEYARFCSDHDINLEKALESGKREYSRRPENIDALDAYAWTLYKNNRSEDAVSFIEKAMRLNTKRSMLHYHAAMIYTAIHNNGKAIKYFQTALKENNYIDILYAENARKALDSLRNLASN
jgi:tetratricopeptide (TPR) repeat protein